MYSALPRVRMRLTARKFRDGECLPKNADEMPKQRNNSNNTMPRHVPQPRKVSVPQERWRLQPGTRGFGSASCCQSYAALSMDLLSLQDRAWELCCLPTSLLKTMRKHWHFHLVRGEDLSSMFLRHQLRSSSAQQLWYMRRKLLAKTKTVKTLRA